MLKAFKSFSPAYQLIFKDKVSLSLALAPVLIGMVFYFFAGKMIYSEGINYGNQLIEQYIGSETVGGVLYYLVNMILAVLLYFFVSWTMVLIVSLIASPFNDILSMRIEKKILGEEIPKFSESFGETISKIVPMIFNEIKKIFFIMTLTIISLAFGFIPVLLPISIMITALLLGAGYIDYSWSRHGLKAADCRKDLKKGFLNYLVGGGFFMILVSIPVINLIVPSFATSFFTVLWVKQNESRN